MTPPLRDFILNNFVWKVTSVVVAILIWITINSSQSSFKWPGPHPASLVSHRLPVTVISTASDMRDFTITPKEVEVAVRGEPAALNTLKVSDMTAFVNLTDVKNETSFRKRVNVYTPTNVIAVSVAPDEVLVERVSPGEPANHRQFQD